MEVLEQWDGLGLWDPMDPGVGVWLSRSPPCPLSCRGSHIPL